MLQKTPANRVIRILCLFYSIPPADIQDAPKVND